MIKCIEKVSVIPWRSHVVGCWPPCAASASSTTNIEFSSTAHLDSNLTISRTYCKLIQQNYVTHKVTLNSTVIHANA